MGNLHQNPRPIACISLTATSPPMIEINQDRQQISNNIVGLFPPKPANTLNL
jgi:hypothetical protein